jgi:ribonuclease HII
VADFYFEKNLLKKGYENIAGVDEAGRGALFGPVVAAAVMFSRDSLLENCKDAWVLAVNDSKLLTPRKREVFARAILASAKAIGVGMATNREIDEKNIRWASFESMRRAITNMSVYPDFLLVDGFRLPDIECDQMGLKQGDRKSISIAAASIVAKVLRDQMVHTLDMFYEGYALAKHKGYGTNDHLRALEEKGPTVFHRISFSPIKQEKR